MDSSLWKPGDVVRLKSGGPDMTIAYFEPLNGPRETVYCGWFVGKKLNQKTFLLEMLEFVRRP
jgi:uncharacterized protein YodC (DUF2158 family)